MYKACAAVLLMGLGCGASAQSKADVSAGWIYGRSDQGTGFANLNGWWDQISYNVSSKVGLGFTNQNFYGDYHRISTNVHEFLFGPIFKFGSSQRKVQPFAQTFIGDNRTSYAGSVTHAFALQVAGGFNVKLNDKLALVISPGQWELDTGGGQTLNSYQAQAGVQVSFGK